MHWKQTLDEMVINSRRRRGCFLSLADNHLACTLAPRIDTINPFGFFEETPSTLALSLAPMAPKRPI